MTERRAIDVGTVWWFWFTTNAFAVDKRLRRILRLLPEDSRCRFCNAPFRGIGGVIVRALFGKRQSVLNPRYCNRCEIASQQFPGGADVPMSVLFADVRGSTAFSASMTSSEFTRLINRFYTLATRIVVDWDALLDKLAGDSIAAF